jgi:hypothetical protein
LSTAKADAIKVQEYTKEYNRLLNLKNTGAGNLSR